MITITDINDVETIIRTFLITQSELNEQYVKNALSNFGTMLNQQIGDATTTDIFDSVYPDQLILLFELVPAEPGENYSESEANDKISFYHSFTIHVMIYGDESKNLAAKLIARIRSAVVGQDLYENGVYVEDVSNMDSTNEYKADVMWLRTDFNISIACQMIIDPLVIHNSFNELNTITIINT